MNGKRVNRIHALIEDRALAAVVNARKRVKMAEDSKARADCERWRNIHLELLSMNGRLSAQVAALTTTNEAMRAALEDIGVYGCGMLNQPMAMNGPEEVWLSMRIRRMEEVARAALAQSDAGRDGGQA